jgi:hypothetical protein
VGYYNFRRLSSNIYIPPSSLIDLSKSKNPMPSMKDGLRNTFEKEGKQTKWVAALALDGHTKINSNTPFYISIVKSDKEK